MALEIPVTNSPRQSLTVVLDGQEMAISIWYQPSDEGWYISVEHPVATPAVTGRRLNSGTSVFADLLSPIRGDIHVVGPDDMGDAPWGDEGTHHLIWFDDQ